MLSLVNNKDFLCGSSLDLNGINFILFLLLVVTVILSEPDTLPAASVSHPPQGSGRENTLFSPILLIKEGPYFLRVLLSFP